MKLSILMDMLFDFLSKHKITASYLAEKYGISQRTVYRYVEELSKKLPLVVKRGRNGGICLSDSYRLPVGFMNAEEYTAAVEALSAAYARNPEPRFLEARRKLTAQIKTEKHTLAITGEAGGFFAETNFPSLTEKTRIFTECIQEETLVEAQYLADDGKVQGTKIEPHALVLRQAAWHIYAFCHEQRRFRLFAVGRILSLIKTEESFRKRPFAWSDIPLAAQAEKRVVARLEIPEKALPLAQQRLGAETLRKTNGKWVAEIPLPEERAVESILGLGFGVKVLAPETLRKKVLAAANAIAKNNA